MSTSACQRCCMCLIPTSCHPAHRQVPPLCIPRLAGHAQPAAGRNVGPGQRCAGAPTASGRGCGRSSGRGTRQKKGGAPCAAVAAWPARAGQPDAPGPCRLQCCKPVPTSALAACAHFVTEIPPDACQACQGLQRRRGLGGHAVRGCTLERIHRQEFRRAKGKSASRGLERESRGVQGVPGWLQQACQAWRLQGEVHQLLLRQCSQFLAQLTWGAVKVGAE